jgi:hypothetical protein
VQQTIRAWRDARLLVFDTPEGRIEVRAGRAHFASDGDHSDSGNDGDTPADVDELLLVARCITRNARRVRLVYAEGVWASELPVAPVAVGERPELVTV